MLIDRDGDADFVKVCDFGLAKQLDAGVISSQLTGHGEVCGTPAYMAPEQARGEPLDGRADVYSVGVMLFHAVVGRLAFRGFVAVRAREPAHLGAAAASRRASPRYCILSAVGGSDPARALQGQGRAPSSAEVFRPISSRLNVTTGRVAGSGLADCQAGTLPVRRRRKGGSAGVATRPGGRGPCRHLAAASFAASRVGPASGRNAPAAPMAVPRHRRRPTRPGGSSPRTRRTRGALASARPVAKTSQARRARARARRQLPPRAREADEAAPSLRAAEERLTAGDIAEACALGQIAAARAPEDPSTWEFLGRCYMRLPDARRPGRITGNTGLRAGGSQGFFHPRDRRARGAMIRMGRAKYDARARAGLIACALALTPACTRATRSVLHEVFTRAIPPHRGIRAGRPRRGSP